MQNLKPVLILLIFCLLLLLMPAAVAADADFSTQISTTVFLTADIPKVSHHITITNETGTRYLQTASYLLESTQPEQATIASPAKISFNHRNRQLQVTYINPVIGKGKFQSLQLEYLAPDLVIKDENFLFLTLPALGANNLTHRTLTVLMPVSLPAPDYIYPETAQITQNGDFNQITFPVLTAQDTVVIRYGNERHLEMDLTFELENQQMTPIETQVALPPDTDFQRVNVAAIIPAPIQVSTDGDNNVIATFKLEPKEKKLVNATLQITLYAKAYTTQPQSKEYLSAQPFWPTRSNDLKSEPKPPLPLHTSMLINHFPGISRSVQSGTKTARQHMSNCLESETITSYEDCVDLVVTLLRAKGIPARRINGVAATATTRTPLLSQRPHTHIWLEYFDSTRNHWFPIDMAQEIINKKDELSINSLNLVATSIHGISDTTPVSAIHFLPEEGISYTFSGIQKPAQKQQFTAFLQTGLLNNLGYKLTLINDNYHTIYDTNYTLIVNNQPIETVYLSRLAPRAQSIIPIRHLLPQGKVQLEINNQIYDIHIKNAAITAPAIITSILVLTASIVAVITGRLLVLRRRK